MQVKWGIVDTLVFDSADASVSYMESALLANSGADDDEKEPAKYNLTSKELSLLFLSFLFFSNSDLLFNLIPCP